MFIAASLRVKKWKQPIYPSAGEWINNVIVTMKYYSAIKRNKALIHG